MNDRVQQFAKVISSITDDVKIIAVSKTQPVEMITLAYNAGLREFGENRVQELLSKKDALPADIKWHLIGHLQTNKVKYIVPFISMIHSVDSIKLLQEINKEAAKIDRVVDCLLQVHIALEETKFGFDATEICGLSGDASLKQLKNVRIRGLMGMATFTDDLTQVRSEFKALKRLFDHVREDCAFNKDDFTELSMGMSSDYQIAIEEGSTMVRLGSILFGSREYIN